MFKTTYLDYKHSGTLNKLVFDYLEKNKNLAKFYGFFPDKNGFSDLLKTAPYKNFNRDLLVDILAEQAKTVKNTNEKTIENTRLLKNKSTYTVTTGHQLCLFTGPLYFIYKIFSTINLAEKLKKDFPDFDFVPVYWMASEDHDFEEVRSFTSNGRSLLWESGQHGAVGNFKTDELKTSLPRLREVLGISENADYLFRLFENAYLMHETLSLATRYLVNELFGKYGLITLDGDDKTFKHQLKDIFKKDIFDSSPARLVNDSIRQLEDLGYHAQVNPREINCFYLEDNLRVRLTKIADKFSLAGTDTSFSEKEIMETIEKHPEKISPNVVLRPIYQQIILPNIAYVGGPGEIAYWLEFKSMFEKLDVFFPIIMPRDFITIVDGNVAGKIRQLKFTEIDFFHSEQGLIKDFMIRQGHVFDLDPEKEMAKILFSAITNKASGIDKTLSAHVSAELQRTLNRLDRISGKANKALKRNSETDLNRIKIIRQAMFPGNTPQERSENFSSFYIKYGPAFFDALKNTLDPFQLSNKILTEN